MNASALGGMRVMELGSRLAAGACGRLLSDLGATVFLAEPRASSHEGKWVDRALVAAGKRSVLVDCERPDDIAVLAALARRCDVALVSSDTDAWPPTLAAAIAACPIVCDITALGAGAARDGPPPDEWALQARTGLMDTTGFADGPPVPIGMPIVELSTAIYAAIATVLAWRVLRRDGVGQRIDMALFDTAINALATFVPAHFGGKPSRRLGNGHSMCSPWGSYRAADGWVLICSATDAQWQHLAARIDPALASNPRYASLASRVELRAELDARIAAWVATQPLLPLVASLSAAGIPSGPIVPVPSLAAEPNLVLRGSIATVIDPVARRPVQVPAALIRFDDEGAPAPVIATPDDGRPAAEQLTAAPARTPRAPQPPLRGLRVIEIGQFTTAPLAARHLASFGADVIKIEPTTGDSAREWPPQRHGTSHFFVLSNGDKRSLALDLRHADGRAHLAALLADADVLVENMKPGSLAGLGFDTARLTALNPRLVYCAISGFGARSAYPGRPAFDTVAQAMSGMMDATRAGGVPLKAGISAADIGGGQMGLLAIVAALERREHTGRGAMIDIAMQEVGAWFTQTQWNAETAPQRVAASSNADADAHSQRTTPTAATVADACADPHTAARALIVQRTDAAGIAWEMLASPLRLQATPPVIGVPLAPPVPPPIAWRHP